jgi:DNA (cytosine-5)-methyltransferase 1
LPSTFGIVDLFAGPGGLGEGFASLVHDDHVPFRIGISVEKEASAHRTLTLRAFLREHRRRLGALPEQFINFHAGLVAEPDWASVDAEAWCLATEEARCLELGTYAAAAAIDEAITRLRRDFDDTILIGGPPCQAYSLVGRARAKGKRGYVPEEDARHYLFREYIRVLDRLRPAAFVMENVKGMLSSTVESRLVFEMLMEDLSSLGTRRGELYALRAIRVEDGAANLREARQPSDFIVRAEAFGVAQRRHRVIIVGIRSDLAGGISRAIIPAASAIRTVADVINALPALRSGLSRRIDCVEEWRATVKGAAKQLVQIHDLGNSEELRRGFEDLEQQLLTTSATVRSSTKLRAGYGNSNDDLLNWLERQELRAVAQHETRGHMASDLSRYMFAAVFGQVHGYSPKAGQFPMALSPDHRNWHSGVFSDRFRVQLAHEASTTVTSHISKDGHYFIHPDPAQCRSLTVREAARLQTFPDDYLFLGNRTQQYVQVGNAVPPYLARQIATLLIKSLSKTDAQGF